MIKVKEISKKCGLSVEQLENYVRDSGLKYKVDFSGAMIVLDDIDVDGINDAYQDYRVKKEEENRRIAKEREEEKKRQEIEKAVGERLSAEALEHRKQVETEFRKVMPSMLVSSGFNFEGYRILKYSGYISGDDVIQVDRGLNFGIFGGGTNVGDALMKSLSEMRRKALYELKLEAFMLGCNAIIGVDFDYIIFDPETANIVGGTTYMPYVFGVTANGNAVVIEKE